MAAVRRKAAEKVELGPSPTAVNGADPPDLSAARRDRASRQEMPLFADSSASFGLLLALGRLTITPAEDYIDPLGRAAARRDGASAKPLTVHTVTEHSAMISWPCSRRRVGCVGFRASGPRRDP